VTLAGDHDGDAALLRGVVFVVLRSGDACRTVAAGLGGPAART
jgi:hypothetical protein